MAASDSYQTEDDMKKAILPILLLSLFGCRSMSISGFITDAVTQKPVGTCQITIARRYAHSDPAGHYAIVAHKSEARRHPMKLVCDGYETRSIDAYVWRTKSREINIKVVPIPAEGSPSQSTTGGRP